MPIDEKSGGPSDVQTSATATSQTQMASGDDIARRRLLKVLATCLGALAGLSVLVPGVGFLFAPLGRRRKVHDPASSERPKPPQPTSTKDADTLSQTSDDAFVEVARLGDLPAGAPLRCQVRQDRHDAWMREKNVRIGACFVGKGKSGEVVAWSTQCPHLGCSIDWSGGRFACPCHNSVFDEAGTRSAGPSPRDMDRLETRVVGERVLVRYQTFRTGTAKKDPVA